MKRQYIIGLDIGTSGCKALLVDDQGAVIAKAFEGYGLSTPHPGWAEQDPEDWWKAVKLTVKKLVYEVPFVNEIKVIGLSGQMHGLVALDKDYNVIRPCILWNDQRTERQCQEIYNYVGGVEALLKLTNNRMLPGYTGGKIIWVRENEFPLYEKITMILNPKDYIRFRLTGEFATEVSDASGTGLFDVRKREWSYQLLDILDIPKEWLPRCYESMEVSAGIMKSIAEELGLNSGLPVVGGGGDAVVQTTGSGVIEPGILGTTIGTAGNVAMALDNYQENLGGKLQVFCNNMPGKWHAMGVTLSAGGSLRWFKDVFGGPEKEVSKCTGKDVYDIFSSEASMVGLGSEGLFFLPYLIGERCPHIDPSARGAFVGLSLRHQKSHILRSVFEGVIFSLRDASELIKDLGVFFTQIRVSGGGALSEFWRQIHADIFSSEVVTVTHGAEGGAYGAALIGGAGIGIWSSVEEAVNVLKVETKNVPEPENALMYERAFEIYRKLYISLKDSFAKTAEIYR